MPPPDLTVPWDDLLCERLRCCTLCGSSQRPLVFLGIAILHRADRALTSLAMSYTLCQRCRQADPDERRVLAFLEQRYGFR